jgi:hypothetical protein
MGIESYLYMGLYGLYTGLTGPSHINTLWAPPPPPPPAVWTTGAAVYKTGQQRKKLTHNSQPQLVTGYVEVGPKPREGRGGKTLGEDVSKLGGGRYMKNPNITDSHSVTNKVQVNLNMLRPLIC